VGASTFADVAGALGLAALLLPAAVAAARARGLGRGDVAQAAVVGIAAAAALLVAAGLLLSAIGGVGTAGWLVVVLVVDCVLLLGARDRAGLARRTVPGLLALAALAATVGAVAFSHASARDDARAERFTQLWILPAGDAAQVGVRNEEGRAARYRLTVEGPPADDGMAGVLLDRTIALDDGREWVGRVVLPLGVGPEKVTARLYRPGGADPYRSVHIWTRSRG
jgi:hypothetical protein